MNPHPESKAETATKIASLLGECAALVSIHGHLDAMAGRYIALEKINPELAAKVLGREHGELILALCARAEERIGEAQLLAAELKASHIGTA